VLEQDGFILHCKNITYTRAFNNNVWRKVMTNRRDRKGESGAGCFGLVGGDALQKHE
jgi:hypothetical protein